MNQKECTLHSGITTSIGNIERLIDELKTDVKDFKGNNTNRHDEIFKRIKELEDQFNEHKTTIIDRVGRIDRKTAVLSGIISVASYFVFQLIWKLLEKSFLGK